MKHAIRNCGSKIRNSGSGGWSPIGGGWSPIGDATGRLLRSGNPDRLPGPGYGADLSGTILGALGETPDPGGVGEPSDTPLDRLPTAITRFLVLSTRNFIPRGQCPRRGGHSPRFRDGLREKVNDFHECRAGTDVALYMGMRFEQRLVLGYTCTRCGEFFTSESVDEKRAHVALFGMTKEVCPICYSTPEERDGRPLPPPPPVPDIHEPDEEADEI